MGARESTNTVAKENDAILAINGDHWWITAGLWCVTDCFIATRHNADALVMNYDGSMQTYSADQLNMDSLKPMVHGRYGRSARCCSRTGSR
jgi:hypothetical protein